ncbi:MAG: hypothetical protein VYE04_09710 [Pseudomonadota bacterium]|nr:hypothetical protein [Pseudomonadota bacterium]
MSQTTIKQVRLAAAHDGKAELIVCLEYANGGTSDVSLDQVASAALMELCAANSLAELTGQSWELVKEALQVSYNRFQ